MKRFLIALAFSLFFIGTACAQPYGMDDDYGGRGMMGRGYGMGGGMMRGGYGMGHGMMWGGGYGCYMSEDLKLSDAQKNQIEAIQKDMRKKQWRLMEEMHEQAWGPGGMHRGGWSDETAARKSFDKMSELRKRMFENRLQTHKQIEEVLTSSQKKHLNKCLEQY